MPRNQLVFLFYPLAMAVACSADSSKGARDPSTLVGSGGTNPEGARATGGSALGVGGSLGVSVGGNRASSAGGIRGTGGGLLSGASGGPSPPDPGPIRGSSSEGTFQASFPGGGHEVIASSEPHGLSDYLFWSVDNPGPKLYYELYPLGLRRYGSTGIERRSEIDELKASGFTSISSLRYDGDSGDYAGDFDAIDKAGGGFTYSLQLNVKSEDEVVRILTQYANSARGRAGAQRVTVNGTERLVVTTYWTTEITAAAWASARARLEANGIPIFLVADYGPWILLPDTEPALAPYAPHMDAYYMFGQPVEPLWTRIRTAMNQMGKPWAGGFMPCTGREDRPDSYYDDALGTARFREFWVKTIEADVAWNVVNTWDDTAEKHQIRPTSEWNWTRADVNRWYSERFRGVPSTFREPLLYVTCPTHVHVNAAPQPCEALILNGGNAPVTASIELEDSQGQRFGSTVAAQVPAHGAGAAQVAVKFDAPPVGRFVRAHAKMLDATGALLSEVESSPVLVYETAQATDLLVFYYSIPASKALPGRVRLELTGNPVAGSSVATVSPPANTQVRFAEVLQNTRQVENLFNQAPFTSQVPLTYACRDLNIHCGKPNISYLAPGFYVGRVIDEDERVGYSDPVYVGAP